ncbi:RlpA-like double-psi beta-barrel-protein domain-containing protein-containing protein [Lobosporangium transversale]|uniref:RlpA-like double-psi beta-barrel-protein domain-containing protein-containing protein n=1 Tax=Lobosporangium transversale TaxID=64571 RepID=A0A1Y2GYK7_9FUNG|nr:RlpA-like double-psi beta-barrel-protein domain-containing protein-containing protein [Lobosporangium transversale]ORZ26894.1 RlpA-like double-psi beta-barrel-protein domain-containing protein-containing protein [Lobosporangium transversale]|eukprot:XP_021884641.1 RlpA-like double-psi beta-barrel-protein domain-containing protein-containing protein [Lobosporangium transversale]
MNPLQFGNPASKNSTCGEWVLVRNRKNTMQSTYAQVVGQCPTCDYGSVDVSLGALSDLAPDLPFESMVFDDSSDTTIDDLMGADTPQPANSTPISPKDLLSVVWELSGPPKHTGTNQIDLPSGTRPTSTTSPTPTSTTEAPKPTSPSSPVFSGRATWYSDTSGFCEHPYSQSDMIVAVNEAQMGRVKDLCGKKILLTKEGSDVQVVVEVVDMCPSKYCKSGDLDLSQAAFKEFADLDVGELTLKWSFLDS